MTLYTYRAVANGLRTDHPISDLPFVDDQHIPVQDPTAIEAIGRHKGEGMHGRKDKCKDGGWMAFTTDPLRHDLGWVVRWHPEHGRSVLVYRNHDGPAVHTVLMFMAPTALLFRAGGYWWDGTTWYRPGQLWDGPAEKYYQRPVPAAVTVTAKDLLQGGDPARARLLPITELDVDAAPPGRWRDDLALWASHRDGSLTDSVVTLAAPELTGDQLVSVTEMAQAAGIGASTLRAYVARGEGDVPLPQATVHGRNMWARPVAEEWAEQRRRSHDGLVEAVAAKREDSTLPSGIAEVWTRFSQTFFSRLWEHPTWRKRWALRWRTETAVREVAETLSWDVAANLTRLVPVHDLAAAIRQAVLHEFADDQAREREIHQDLNIADDPPYDQLVAISPQIANVLDWLIRHDPATAGHAIQEIIGESERGLGLPRQVSEDAIRTALALDGTLDEKTREDFLHRVLTPETSSA